MEYEHNDYCEYYMDREQEEEYNKEQEVLRIERQKKVNEVPYGYKKIKSATTGRDGYEWYSNGKSRFSKEYKSILVKIDIEDII